jgi:hypothetical protein
MRIWNWLFGKTRSGGSASPVVPNEGSDSEPEFLSAVIDIPFPQLYRHVEQVAKSPLHRGVARWRS